AGAELMAAVKPDGTVLVEGEVAGHLEGFHFRLDGTSSGGTSSGGTISGRAISGPDTKPLLTAVRRVLTTEIPARLARLERDDDATFALDGAGGLSWNGAVVARLAAGETALSPRVAPVASEFLDGRARERLRLRLATWLRRHLEERLASACACAWQPGCAGTWRSDWRRSTASPRWPPVPAATGRVATGAGIPRS
ncbi:MAG: hypothetical protein ACTSQ7_04080, partial [Alphaproteobacteria bacterium]